MVESALRQRGSEGFRQRGTPRCGSPHTSHASALVGAQRPRLTGGAPRAGARARPTLVLAALALVVMAAGLSGAGPDGLWFAQHRGIDRNPGEKFSFVIIGDRTASTEWGLMPQAFREINRLAPDFVISVGDLIEGYGKSPRVIHELWGEFDQEVRSLRSPFVYVPGNHDIWNATSRGVYEARYGPTYRSFNYRGLHLVTLNTEERGRDGAPSDCIAGAQLEWLRRDLANNRSARGILIFMHRPLWQTGGLDAVYESLRGLPVHVFAGHHHRYSYEEIRGIPHVVLGAVAASIPGEGREALGCFRHYVLATACADELRLALIRLGGVMGPEVVLESELPAIERLASALSLGPAGQAGCVRALFRNPLPLPVRLEIERLSGGTADGLLGSAAPSVDPHGVWEEELASSLFEPRGSGGGARYRAVYHFTNSRGEPQSIEFPVNPHPEAGEE